jgi:cytidylate kinase
MDTPIPVITIDGPSASGKGSVAARVAARMGYHFLDSGALYRLTALAADQEEVAWDDELRLGELAAGLPVTFLGEQIFLYGEDCSEAIRSEHIGQGASKVAALPQVRAALLARQHAFRQAPGLVADGRDMGSVVFPDATLKIFLTASVEERANRRYKQLIGKGFPAILRAILQELQERDARDAARSVAPLQKTDDALLLDTSAMGIEQAVEFVVKHAQQRGLRVIA